MFRAIAHIDIVTRDSHVYFIIALKENTINITLAIY